MRTAAPIVALAAAVLASTPLLAAYLSPAEVSDLKRAYAAAALSSSEEPAVRAERRLREPSAGFLLGAALGAWSAARDQLDYDLKNPQAAGAAHASQGPANLDALDDDCRDEKTAFDRLQARSLALALTPAAVVGLTAAPQTLVQTWGARRAGPAPACIAAR